MAGFVDEPAPSNAWTLGERMRKLISVYGAYSVELVTVDGVLTLRWWDGWRNQQSNHEDADPAHTGY